MPFLPLRRRHVERCAQRELCQRGECHRVDVASSVGGAMNYMPQDSPYFSSTGCKLVPAKVNLFLWELYIKQAIYVHKSFWVIADTEKTWTVYVGTFCHLYVVWVRSEWTEFCQIAFLLVKSSKNKLILNIFSQNIDFSIVLVCRWKSSALRSFIMIYFIKGLLSNNETGDVC